MREARRTTKNQATLDSAALLGRCALSPLLTALPAPLLSTVRAQHRADPDTTATAYCAPSPPHRRLSRHAPSPRRIASLTV